MSLNQIYEASQCMVEHTHGDDYLAKEDFDQLEDFDQFVVCKLSAYLTNKHRTKKNIFEAYVEASRKAMRMGLKTHLLKKKTNRTNHTLYSMELVYGTSKHDIAFQFANSMKDWSDPEFLEIEKWSKVVFPLLQD